ncbi:hypothetical protein LOK49_LG01G04049 [Camellia lanceoleosa]|uniref:Uncharacterized protein n=1 Tax=Camellia lanceoleosa TaxID=1840588 RepID=A0ACC0IZE8_9ERIC|nr:hypothetical protein LOK49_LG01G04049 [Camellia lanceoleosa]
MMQNVTVAQPTTGNGSGTSKPTGSRTEEGFNLDEKLGYGPWTIAPSRRKSHQGRTKQKAQYQKSNRFDALQLDKEHGENSEGLKSSMAQGSYVDLDLVTNSTNIVNSNADCVQNKSPLDTLVQVSPEMDVELDQTGDGRRLDIEMGMAPGPSGTEELQQANQSVTPKSGPQSGKGVTLSQGNPKTNSVSKPQNTTHTSPNLSIEKTSVTRSRARGGKSLAPGKSVEVRTDGRRCRDLSNDRTSCGSEQDAAIFRARERSISPHRSRMVARRSETDAPTLVGDRLAQCETHGACEASENIGGGSGKSEKYSGST